MPACRADVSVAGTRRRPTADQSVPARQQLPHQSAGTFNSDNLLSPAQCDDLLHGREVTDWHLPVRWPVFPDLLLLLPCRG